MVISVGYKVKSKTATRFRKWATNIINEHITGNYSMLAQEEALRLLTRVQVDDSTVKMVTVATTEHRVKDKESFLDAGDKGMYHTDRRTLEDNRKIPHGKLYDYVGSAELGMHVYRLTQTAEALSVDAKNATSTTKLRQKRSITKSLREHVPCLTLHTVNSQKTCPKHRILR